MSEFISGGSFPTIPELLSALTDAQQANRLMGKDTSAEGMGPALERSFGEIEGIVGKIMVVGGEQSICAVSGPVFRLLAALYPDISPQFERSLREIDYSVEAINLDTNAAAEAILKFTSAVTNDILITGILAKKLNVKNGDSVAIKLLSANPQDINLDNL